MSARYQAYLRSPHWKQLSARIRRRDRYTCTDCARHQQAASPPSLLPPESGGRPGFRSGDAVRGLPCQGAQAPRCPSGEEHRCVWGTGGETKGADGWTRDADPGEIMARPADSGMASELKALSRHIDHDVELGNVGLIHAVDGAHDRPLAAGLLPAEHALAFHEVGLVAVEGVLHAGDDLLWVFRPVGGCGIECSFSNFVEVVVNQRGRPLALALLQQREIGVGDSKACLASRAGRYWHGFAWRTFPGPQLPGPAPRPIRRSRGILIS